MLPQPRNETQRNEDRPPRVPFDVGAGDRDSVGSVLATWSGAKVRATLLVLVAFASACNSILGIGPPGASTDDAATVDDARALILALGFIGGLSLGLVGVRFRGVDADVPPPAERLFYAGELREGGAPAAGPRDIEVRFHSAATGNGNQICTSGLLANTPLVDGHFRINVGAACVTALAAAQNAYVEVVVGGVSLPSSTTPRPRVAAVPYAAQATVAAAAAALTGPLAASNVTTASGTVETRLNALDARVTGTVVAPGNDRLVRARLSNNSAGGCVVTSQSGTWVAGSMRTAVAGCEVTIATGTFSATPSCWCNNLSGGNRSCNALTASATSLQTTTTLQQANGNTLEDAPLDLICMGPT